jgi:hypothetical protein
MISIETPRRQRSVVVLIASATLMTVPVSAAPARAPAITQVYATAETSSSASVVWNTNVASDSRLHYSTRSPVPPDAPQVYLPTPATYHEIALSGLMPATLYHYRVTSCAKKGCASATGSFDTFPSCPDEVPPIAGSWQKEPSPNVSESIGFRNELLGVAAISEGDVWAVGRAQDPAGPPYARRALIQHFDGTAWSIVPSPNRSGHTHNVLHGVSGTSASDVWAVGFSHDGTLPSRTLIQHWDGTKWAIVPSPSPEDQLNELRAVAAISADDAWAVGFRSGTGTQEPIDTFVLHWDGSAWTHVPSPNIAGGANQLFGITAVSADEIWAVGFAAGGPLAMRWNGSAWSLVPVPPDAGLRTDWLTGVSGKAADDLWAVGQGKGIFSNQTFATLRHWDGTHWTDKVCRAASASNPPDGYEGGGPDAYFTGVSAAARDDVWAVGVRGSGPMILHWDGVAWTTVTHPRAFPRSATPRGVATTSGGGAWSVGVDYEIDPTGQTTTDRTLIYRYR